MRPARKSDIPAIVALIREFSMERRLLARSREEIEAAIESFFVAVLDGDVVGCAALEIYAKKLAEIRSLCVAPAAQGKGVGTALVEACTARAKERDILEVMAITSQDTFFAARGFDYALPNERKAMFYQTKR